MRLLITLGPSYEPLDGARRLTNMSTGRLGTVLANDFVAAGWDVTCLRGEGASYRGPLSASLVETFTTNDDLALRLERLGAAGSFDAVFHAAALCDYRIARVVGADGQTVVSPKISTRDGRLTLELEPATKVLPRLRSWFPGAKIVGWKYELAGAAEDAFSKAWRQLADNGADACVLNGAAYGEGFAICFPGGGIQRCADPEALSRQLRDWSANPRPV